MTINENRRGSVLRARRKPGYLRGTLATLTALAIMSSTAVGLAATATAAPGDAGTLALSNGKGLTVAVGDAFPQVVSYNLAGQVIGGQSKALTTFMINGQAKTATTTVAVSGATATYQSTIASPAIVITSTITVTSANTVEFKVTKISGAGEASVNTLSIPGHSLLSVSSAEAGAVLSRTKNNDNITTPQDQYLPVTTATAVDAAAVGTPYGFVNNEKLAAGIITNATEDSGNNEWNNRLFSQVENGAAGAKVASLSPGTFTYHPQGASDPRVATFDLPQATVVLAGDVNGSGKVDWQDAAIAYRNNAEKPLGSDKIPDRVVARIPFNFGSAATNPFLKTLDNVKRFSMATDNLGQWILEKGYQSEGHDSAHPDYGNDINTRAGGVEDFKTLVNSGAKYNTEFGVHVNATEAYAQAQYFSENLIGTRQGAWDWLNSAYKIDMRNDLGKGNVLDRFQELKDTVPGVKSLYIDAYLESGAMADGLANNLQKMGFEITTEYAHRFESNAIWSHWANDKNYGDNKGISSKMIRFIANSDRDLWNTDPLLGGQVVKDYEGWSGQKDFNATYSKVWSDNLPTKFLQHYELMDWQPGTSAKLQDADGHKVAIDMVGGVRKVTLDGKLVIDGNKYLIPWQDVADPDVISNPNKATKLYFYNAAGGTATFDLPTSFAGTSNLELFKLTDNGRVKVTDVAAAAGKVTLTGDAATAYVLVPAGGKAPQPAANYGQGTGLVDPGFNTGNVTAWNATGGATAQRTALGDYVAVLGDSASSISQSITGLTPGKKYTVSADIEIAQGQHRATALKATGTGLSATNSFDVTPMQNRMASDSKSESYAQRAPLTFTAPADGRAKIEVSAAAGSAKVSIDNVRVMIDAPLNSLMTNPLPVVPTTLPDVAGNVVFTEGFEGNQPGWGPFFKGNNGGLSDPQTSISQLHAPFTQKDWKGVGQVDDVITEKGGTHSLKAHNERAGLTYRTAPVTLPFTFGHEYEITFDYQSNGDNQWQWVTGVDSTTGTAVVTKEINNETLAPALSTTSFSSKMVAGCGSSWVGLRRIGSGSTDMVLDNMVVRDLGPAANQPGCAKLDVAPVPALTPQVPAEIVTTFVNSEETAASNVQLSLGTPPAGWTFLVKEKNGNLFDTVAPGASVSTTWVVVPAAGSGGSTTKLSPTAIYRNDNVTKTVSNQVNLPVQISGMVPVSKLKVTTDSQQATSGAEGPISNVLDGDLSTIWHSKYDTASSPFPHWAVFDLSEAYDLTAFGFQGRQTGGDNGRIKDYKIYVSNDGVTWGAAVASGSLNAGTDMQILPIPAGNKVRYVKFEALNAHNGLGFAAAAEMRVYGSNGSEPVVTPPVGFEPGQREPDVTTDPTTPPVTTDPTTLPVTTYPTTPPATTVPTTPPVTTDPTTTKPTDPTTNPTVPSTTAPTTGSKPSATVPATSAVTSATAGPADGLASTGSHTAGLAAFAALLLLVGGAAYGLRLRRGGRGRRA
ncbi:endo-alpha-N-acetylgalactosaminidase family protein [Arthrobacter sp. LAPM80]|uniref:endo-alpha-N-acetylgalactosaminidase family protein n=1 Tax=Arthrobacter sp. LAPM80 TaxID=3141788 RepID=UPI00398A6E29